MWCRASSVDGSPIAREILCVSVVREQSSVGPVDAVDFGLLALMGSANRVPLCLSDCDASGIPWVVPAPGLTGLAITSRHSRNLEQPGVTRLNLLSLAQLVSGCVCAMGFSAHHQRPNDPRHLVGHGGGRGPHRLSHQQRGKMALSGLPRNWRTSTVASITSRRHRYLSQAVVGLARLGQRRWRGVN
jgi:hypothetical protein